MYNPISPTFSATDALIRDYENKALFWFRWAASLIEYVFTFLLLVSFIIRYAWNHTIIPI
ncbi:unnamed protein product [Rotaria sp. Silwood2]|nr:unnamed protein product [Rotaria sp. Silwood2]